MTLLNDEMPWISDYEPRNWESYQMFITPTEEQLPITPCDDYVVCATESIKAAFHWKDQQLGRSVPPAFYYDAEQLLGAEFDDVYGVSGLFTLTREWNSHPEGALVLPTYNGSREHGFIFLVESKS